MTKYLLDSWAWIEYFEGSSLGKRVGDYLEKADCYTSSLSVAEVTAKLLKNNRDPAEGYMVMGMLSKELPVDNEVGFEAGRLYVEKRKTIKDIGIVDVFMMTQARRNKMTIITGDAEHFKDEKNVVLLKE